MSKLVAFDLDGTVADTLADLAAAVNFALEKRGLSPYPVDDYRQFVGNGADNLMRTVLKDHATDDAVREMKEDFSLYYADHCLDATAAYPGLSEVLGRLADAGVMTAVISNKPHRFVPMILNKLYPGHRFTLMWGQQPQYPRKPAPDALLAAMEQCGVSADKTLYVGDSNVDVAFAHSAGVKVCGVSWGFRGRGELTAAGADFIADTPNELMRIIHEQA